MNKELSEQAKIDEDCCWDSIRSHCNGKDCKCTCHKNEKVSKMKFKGVAKLYLKNGAIIEQECDSVTVRMGTDGYVQDVMYNTQEGDQDLLVKDLKVKFMQRVELVAVTFEENKTS